MRRNVIFSFICATVIFICSFAVLCPNVQRVKYNPIGEPVEVSDPSEGIVITTGSIDSSGRVRASEDMACVVEFPVKGKNIQSLEISFTKGYGATTQMAIENTVDGSFTDRAAVYASVTEGDKSVCVELECADYKAVRIWFGMDCMVKKISFYDTVPNVEGVQIKISAKRYVLTAVITLLALFAAFFIDKKFDLSKTILDYIKEKRFAICTFIIGSGVAIALGVVTECIFRIFAGPDSVGNSFNRASCVMFCAIYQIVFVFLFERKKIGTQPEKALFFIILTLGICVILVQPFSHNSWDIDSHYPWALQNSFYRTAYYTAADWGIKTNELFVTAANLQENNIRIETLNAVDQYAVQIMPVTSSIPHKLSGIFIAVARLFGVSFFGKYLIGEFAILLVYATVCYFAVKRIKSGKMILSVIALFPTNIFLATNYSYDYWVTSFCLLGTSYFISELQEPDKPISVKDTVIMGLAFALGALPKLVYIIIMCMTLFMRKNWNSSKQKRNYYLVIITIFVVVFAFFMLRSLSAIGSAGDSRGGDVNPSAQLSGIISNPLGYANILFKFLFKYLSIGGMKEYISHFAYLGIGKYWMIVVFLLAFVSLTDGNKNLSFKIPLYMRGLAVLMLVGMAALIATALYIDFTPLNNPTIAGCQPRYIIPLVAPVLLIVTGKRFDIIKNKSLYNSATLTVSSIVLLLEIYSVIVIRMI